MVLEEFRRGAVRLHVLHHAAEHDVHGAWLTQELARHGHHISPGTLYPVLHQMEAAGLLDSHEAVVEGRVLRRYRATGRGRRELDACRQALRELVDEVLE